MSVSTQAGDWNVALLGAVAVGSGPAGGGWLCLFSSDHAAVTVPFVFGGYGLGFGSLAQVEWRDVVQALRGQPIEYEAIRCDQHFSVQDLNNSAGNVLGAGGGIGPIGASYFLITAFTLSDVWFSAQSIGMFKASNLRFLRRLTRAFRSLQGLRSAFAPGGAVQAAAGFWWWPGVTL
jgi:hypothetical protein